MKTIYGCDVSDQMVAKRVNALVNQFYKILPLKEEGESSLAKYMLSLQREMVGMKTLMVALDDDPQYLTLLSILQYLIDHDCDVATVKMEVFKAINVIKRLQKKIAASEKEG